MLIQCINSFENALKYTFYALAISASENDILFRVPMHRETVFLMSKRKSRKPRKFMICNEC